ncbi:GGDEF domain-containing protein [Undibacterium arcticum]|uniref:diguanylate cyclase n=2 Tax=Undibacterium arcticum TaxID=1762892 RepID=A0ABV7F4D3_9BURK
MTMEAILKHMLDITCHRDHMLLDRSVIAAIQQLAGASQVWVWSIASHRGELFMRPAAWTQDDQGAADWHPPAQPESQEQPLRDFPELAACVQQRNNRAHQTGSNGEHILWLPVWSSDTPRCCVEIVNHQPYSQQALNMIDGILGVYRNFQNLLDYSERDSLTGLLNRKTFDGNFATMQSATVVPGTPTAPQPERRHYEGDKEQWLAVVDIDHFKRVNDQFGHLYGDEVLILIANLLQTSFRSQDRIFRFGGEEFVILLCSATPAQAHTAVERFRSNVETHYFPQIGQITVSVGYTNIKSQQSPVMILGHADQALYYAKTHGRNQTCHYDELLARGDVQTVVANDRVEFF